MQAALREARRGVGLTSPNPAVGAVIARRTRSGGMRILARGWHRAAGEPHAEIEALRALGDPARARGATLAVTLEPCSTHGRTPPCVGAILEAGLARVVIGTLDPNPAHAGRAVPLLEAGGIAVRHGVLEAQCRELNRAFNHWIVTGEPWVIAKAGLSLDGRIARRPGESPWITNARSRADAHRLRARVDAILVGGGTLRADNPRLTVRGVPGARQPWRVVVSRSGNLPAEAALFTDGHRERTWVFTGEPLREVLRELGRRGVTSVMIEGGARLLGEAMDARLIHEVCFYIAPVTIGGPTPVIGGLGVGSNGEAVRLREVSYRRFGDDLRLTGQVEAVAAGAEATQERR